MKASQFKLTTVNFDHFHMLAEYEFGDDDEVKEVFWHFKGKPAS